MVPRKVEVDDDFEKSQMIEIQSWRDKVSPSLYVILFISSSSKYLLLLLLLDTHSFKDILSYLPCLYWLAR